MEVISEKIAKLLLEKNYIESSMYDIYKYGIMMLFEVMLSFITSIFICCMMGMFLEGIIFFALFIPIRSYLGGLHMKSYVACFLCSGITMTLILILVKYLKPEPMISVIVLTFCEILIIFLATKDRKKSADGKEYFTKICYILIITESIGMFLFLYGCNRILFLIACTMMLATLSKLCENLIK